MNFRDSDPYPDLLIPFNPFNASWTKLQLFKGFSAILV